MRNDDEKPAPPPVEPDPDLFSTFQEGVGGSGVSITEGMPDGE